MKYPARWTFRRTNNCATDPIVSARSLRLAAIRELYQSAASMTNDIQLTVDEVVTDGEEQITADDQVRTNVSL